VNLTENAVMFKSESDATLWIDYIFGIAIRN